MAFTEQELNIAKQVKEQGGSREDFIDILQQVREQAPKAEITPSTTTLPAEAEAGIKQEVQTTESLGRAGAGLGALLGTQKEVVEKKEPSLLESAKESAVQLGETVGAFGKGVVETGVGVAEAAEETFTGLAKVGQKKTLDLANVIRKKLGKPELSIDEATKAGLDPIGGLESNIQEDLLDIGGGSLTLGFTSFFPGSTTVINSMAETEGGGEILKLLSTGIGKGGEFVNKLPGLKEFKEKLPEDKRAEFDSFIGQVSTLGLSKLIGKGIKKGKESRLRTSEEVAANILGPTARTPLDFSASVKGLKQLGPVKPTSFIELQKMLKNKESKVFKPLKEGLENAQKNIKPIKDVSVGQALDGLETILENQPGKKFTTIKNRIKELKNKHETEGLTLLELQEIKTLHTQQNSLFSELGKETGGFSKDGLRAVRNDIKTLIEKEAERGGFKDVKDINTRFGELENANQFVKLREGNLKSYLGRQGKQSFLQDVTSFVLELPGIKQGFTAPVQTILNKLGRSLREGKVNPLEVQAQLPQLFKELRAAGVKEGTVTQIGNNISAKLGGIGIVAGTDEGDLLDFLTK